MPEPALKHGTKRRGAKTPTDALKANHHDGARKDGLAKHTRAFDNAELRGSPATEELPSPCHAPDEQNHTYNERVLQRHRPTCPLPQAAHV